MKTRTKEEVIEEIQSVAQALNTKVLSETQFLRHSDVTKTEWHNLWPTWCDACQAAGIDCDRTREKISDEDLLSDWGRAVRKLGKLPSIAEYRFEGRYGRGPFDRFGYWRSGIVERPDVPKAFRDHFADSDEWQDVLEIVEGYLSTKRSATAPAPQPTRKTTKPGTQPKIGDRVQYGPLISFRALTHAPLNENGVILLFGMVAADLGFAVEAIQPDIFPDCIAKQRLPNGRLEPVTIEFEFESKTFVDHNHDPEGCDIIVCWKHNWSRCPSHIRVIELSDEIERLRQGR